jgi:hypothetical protein
MFEAKKRGAPIFGNQCAMAQRSSPARSAREIELQALATLAALAQISTPSAAHFLKSHQLLVQKFAADRDRQKGPPECCFG